MLDPLSWHWTLVTDIKFKGPLPLARVLFGLAGAAGKLFVFGGVGMYGRRRVSLPNRA